MPNCRDCKVPIKFAKRHGAERVLPIDAKPTFEGGFVLFHQGGVLTARRAHLPADQMRPRHRAHYETCPKRKDRR